MEVKNLARFGFFCSRLQPPVLPGLYPSTNVAKYFRETKRFDPVNWQGKTWVMTGLENANWNDNTS